MKKEQKLILRLFSYIICLPAFKLAVAKCTWKKTTLCSYSCLDNKAFILLLFIGTFEMQTTMVNANLDLWLLAFVENIF